MLEKAGTRHEGIAIHLGFRECIEEERAFPQRARTEGIDFWLGFAVFSYICYLKF